VFAAAHPEPMARTAGLGRNLTHGLFDRLGRAIVAGRFDTAPFPVEMELVRHYGVSLGVIREALKMLAAKGLVSARPRQGTLVEPASRWNLLDADVLRWMLEQPGSPELLLHFNALRMAVEPEAAAIAACTAGPEDLGRIGRALARMAAASRGRDDALDAVIAFHLAVLRAARNPFYTRFEDLVPAAFRAAFRMPRASRNPAPDIPSRRLVLDAIAARDPDRARRSMSLVLLAKGRLG
jgi:DNA-binding FadR family transcriptional regulator